jgi:SAM domain (Sterile alpha motif)
MDIGGWLRGLGLERYEQAFRENEIDLRVLPELTADDLKELGVAAIGHRRLLRKAPPPRHARHRPQRNRKYSHTA